MSCRVMALDACQSMVPDLMMKISLLSILGLACSPWYSIYKPHFMNWNCCQEMLLYIMQCSFARASAWLMS
jgi:hypothetical protein